MDDRTPAGVFADVESVRVHVADLLANRAEPLLHERPPSGKWSVVENVRHMLFAEQAHLGKYHPDGQQWSPYARPPEGLQRRPALKHMVENRDPALVHILSAWEEHQSDIRPAIEGLSLDGVPALEAHLRHQQSHVLIIERLLRAMDRAGL